MEEYERVEMDATVDLNYFLQDCLELLQVDWVKLPQNIKERIYAARNKTRGQILAIKGIRIERDDQSLPENPYVASSLIPLSEGHIGYAEAQQDMLKAGFVKVLKKE